MLNLKTFFSPQFPNLAFPRRAVRRRRIMSRLRFLFYFACFLCCRSQLQNFADEYRKGIGGDDDDGSEATSESPVVHSPGKAEAHLQHEEDLQDMSEGYLNTMIMNKQIEMVVDENGRKRIQYVTWMPTVTPVPSPIPSSQPSRQPSSQASYCETTGQN